MEFNPDNDNPPNKPNWRIHHFTNTLVPFYLYALLIPLLKLPLNKPFKIQNRWKITWCLAYGVSAQAQGNFDYKANALSGNIFISM